MTSFAPLPSVRRPFGEVDQSRLQGLVSLKNRQNAILQTSTTSPLKRRAPTTTFVDEDTENIDPASFASAAKKSKISLGGTASSPLYPTSKFSLTTTPTPASIITKASSAPRPTRTPSSPSARLRGRTAVSSNVTPKISSAAGRSPKSKRVGILSRHRVSNSPFSRVDPPHGLSTPFSIDAALDNTFNLFNNSPVPRATPVVVEPEPVPESSGSNGDWSIRRLKPSDLGMSPALFFDIHEDTEDAHLTNMMEHSTNVLDISDDESRNSEKSARGKENVPPSDFTPPQASAVQSATTPLVDPASLPLPPSPSKHRRRRAENVMSDDVEESRAPLGDLNPTDYAADEGEVANVQENDNETEGFSVVPPSRPAFDFEAETSEKAVGGEVSVKSKLSFEITVESLPPHAEEPTSARIQQCADAV